MAADLQLIGGDFIDSICRTGYGPAHVTHSHTTLLVRKEVLPIIGCLRHLAFDQTKVTYQSH